MSGLAASAEWRVLLACHTLRGGVCFTGNPAPVKRDVFLGELHALNGFSCSCSLLSNGLPSLKYNDYPFDELLTFKNLWYKTFTNLDNLHVSVARLQRKLMAPLVSYILSLPEYLEH